MRIWLCGGDELGLCHGPTVGRCHDADVMRKVSSWDMLGIAGRPALGDVCLMMVRKTAVCEQLQCLCSRLHTSKQTMHDKVCSQRSCLP